MKVLVTGATGFVGSHVADVLLQRGYDVRTNVRKSSSMRWLEGKKIETVQASLDNADSLLKAVDGVEMVIHVAGLTSARSKEEFLKGNRDATDNLLKAVVKKTPNIKRFLHVSSLAAVGPSKTLQDPVNEQTPYHPITAYGISKKEAEEVVFAQKDNLPVTIVRPPAVYGPRDSAILTVFQTVKSGIAPLIGFDEKRVSLIHVGDLARGIVDAAVSNATLGRAYFVSSEDFYTWDEINTLIAKTLGKKRLLKIKLPHSLVMGIAGISEVAGRFLPKPPVLNYEKGRDITQTYWTCSIDRAKKDFGYTQQISLEKGITETTHWYKQHGWL
ncbi:MAG TPA: NAD-dependent epimerase/dehydratase family protein [Patescibacteria group bacterium]|nr:NAD-dependent epimerase/dehydratase family protein [Patescibacteria group bacterium]